MNEERKVLAVKAKPRRSIICHFCNKPGHMKKESWKFAQSEAGKGGARSPKVFRHTINSASEGSFSSNDHISSDDEALVVGHALSISSKDTLAQHATCVIMKHSKEMRVLDKSQEVSLGDGRILEASAEGPYHF